MSFCSTNMLGRCRKCDYGTPNAIHQTIRLYWINSVTCGASIRLLQSHTENGVASATIRRSLMPELSEHLNSMTSERALQTARKLAEDLSAKGFGCREWCVHRLSIIQICPHTGLTPGAS